MTNHLRRPYSSFSLLAAALAFGCGSDADPSGSQPEDTATSGSSLMVAASDCTDVDEGLAAQFRSELRRLYAAGQCPSSTGNWVGGPGLIGVGGSGTSVDEGSAPSIDGNFGAGGVASGGSTSAGSGKGESDSGDPTTVTGTNVQVAGVDEADIIKTDGKNLYVLHDNTLELVSASTTGALSSITGLLLEGSVREMFVVGSAKDPKRKVVVIADVNGQEVYQRAGEAIPSSTPGYQGSGASSGGDVAGPAEEEAAVGVGGATSIGSDPMPAAGGTPTDVEAPVASAGSGAALGTTTASGWTLAEGVVVAPRPKGPRAGVTTQNSYGPVGMTKVTVLDATDTALTVTSQVYYDGYYQSSRRDGNRVHAVLQVARAWPALAACPTDADRLKAEMVIINRLIEEGKDIEAVSADALEELVANELVDEMLATEPELALSLSYSDFVPRRFVWDGSELASSTLECSDMFLPRAGSSLTGVTYVAEIDIIKPTEDAGSAAILGQASILYGNGTALVLATNQSELVPETQMWGELAYVHRFDLGEEGVGYRASAAMPGRIKDQFSLDIGADDELRVVTSEGWWSEQENRLSIWSTPSSPGLLEKVGSVGKIGDGEDVKSVRFLGDTAYVVTYLQTDPLFAIDVSEPESPVVLGALGEIPGFSTYIHPMDENHLLTIGYDTDNWSPMIQIFDVTDRTQPKQDYKLALAPTGSSLALEDYKAFTYYPEQKLLAIPFSQYAARPMNSMALFRVDVDTGIQLLGQVDGDFILGLPASDANSYCYNWGDSQSMFARSVFFDDVLFAIAPRGIAAVSAKDPSEVYSRLVFSQATEQTSFYCEPVYYGGEGGAAGAPTEVGVGGAVSVGAGGAGGTF